MYKILDSNLIKEYINETSEIRSLILNSNESVDCLDISEIGDGNLNFVYIVKSHKKSIILKQAVPYLRCVGKDYPLSRVRMTFEIEALLMQKKICPDFVPEIYYSSHEMSVVIMQNLNTHNILRGEMIKRVQFPLLSEHISTFLADTLFYTTDFYLTSKEKKENLKKFINIELCSITEDFIFTHPFEDNATNEYNPKLDMKHVKKFREDKYVKAYILKMKHKFMTNGQALLHGDLHSGSIMLNKDETYVIDPEFAFYGPIGFDVGIYLANLIMSYFSIKREEEAYKEYVKSMIKDTWNMFENKYKANMIEHEKKQKSLQFDYPNGEVDFEFFVDGFMADIFEDSIGFASCEMFRRTVGLAKVADVADINDLELRANIEIKILECASSFIKLDTSSIDKVIEIIESHD